MSDESIYKIRASRVNSISADQYDGYEGLIWYDTFTGELRIWDNNVPGGRLIYDNTGSSNSIVSGNTNVSIPAANGNVAITVSGIANTVVFDTANATFAGNLLPTANTYTLGTADRPWKSLHVSGNTIYIDNNTLASTGSNLYWNDQQVVAANANGAINASGVSVSGNIVGGNITTTGVVSATGNVSGNYILGNGSQLSGISVNKLVNNAYEFALDSSGNVTAPGAISAVGNISATNFITTGSNVQAGNIISSGIVSAAGNVLGNYFLGDGSQLTNLPTGGSNITIKNQGNTLTSALNTMNFTGNGVVATNVGNVVTVNITAGSGSGLPSQTGNAGKILSTDGTNPLWETMPGVFGLVIDGGNAAFASTDFIIDGGTAA